LQTQRTCSTFNVGAVEGAIGMALAPAAASAASAAEESRTAIGLLIEALHEWISLMETVWPCRAELQLNVRRKKTPRRERDIDARAAWDAHSPEIVKKSWPIQLSILAPAAHVSEFH
jgi:hypothetical protein